jgi:ABC-type nitrate/sulfonate/bicarbonate transport system permease component
MMELEPTRIEGDPGPQPASIVVPLAARGKPWLSLKSQGNLLRLGSVVVFLCVWQYIGSRMNPILLPQPTAVAQALGDLAFHGNLINAVWASFQDLLVGVGLAAVVGISIGIIMGRYKLLEQMLSPYVSFMNATPTVALLPVVIIWFGIGFKARVIFVFLLALWSILVNTSVGIKNVNRGLMEVAISYGLSEFQIIRGISIPAATPYILAGVRVGLAKGIVGMIIGEMDMQLAGIGGLAAIYGDSFQTARLLAVVFCSSIFAVILIIGLGVLERTRYGWISETSGQRR